MTINEKELKEFRKEANAWLRDNIPADPGFLLPQTFMEVGSDQQLDFMREWQHKVWNAGYLGMAWPKEYGGAGVSAEFQKIFDEEMAQMRAPIMFNAIGNGWAGPLILHTGTEAQKQKYLKRILSAEDIWCQGFSEPDNGSDLGNAQVRATRDGDDYIINGTKTWTTLGNYAQHMILLARTNPEAERKYDGLSFFLAPMEVPGVDPRPIRKLTGDYGFTETFFTDARIPASSMMGNEGEGWKIAMKTLEYERAVEAGTATSFSMTNVFAKDVVDMAAKLKRDGQPLLSDPVVRDRLVQFLMEQKTFALNPKRAEIPALSSDYPASLAIGYKLSGSEFTRRLRQYAVELQGAHGSAYVGDAAAIDGGFWQRAYFNNFSTTIGGGTSQIQANIIGEHVLGLPKS